ncbi:MAG: hypothetical protein ABIJ47_05260, partial [Candidatus Bathyarchaeota archaeon]
VSNGTSLPSKCDIIVAKTDNSGKMLWSKIYDKNEMDFSYSIEETTDKGYLILGSTVKSNQYYIWLIKIDSNGNILWEKNYDNLATSFQKLNGGGYLAIGLSGSFTDRNTHPYLLRIDSNGNKVSDQSLDLINYSTASTLLTSDNKLLITGITNIFNYDEQKGFVLKIGIDESYYSSGNANQPQTGVPGYTFEIICVGIIISVIIIKRNIRTPLLKAVTI